MESEKSNWEKNIGPDEEQLSNSLSNERREIKEIKKINLNFAEKEKQRQKEEEAKIYQQRMQRLKAENEQMQAEYSQRQSLTEEPEVEVKSKKLNSERVSNPGKITGINFLKELSESEKIEQDLAKISDEKHALERQIAAFENDLRSLLEIFGI